MRKFKTGATRDTDENKLDYEGFFSPLVLKRRAEYMHKNRVQADGQLRASDNWQKGIPKEAYASSLWRHFMEVWLAHRGEDIDIQEALCALMFNAEGYLHELLKRRGYDDPQVHLDAHIAARVELECESAEEVAMPAQEKGGMWMRMYGRDYRQDDCVVRTPDPTLYGADGLRNDWPR